MTLCVRFWGTRGSIPTPGPQSARYGGNTPCLEVRTADGRLVVLDGGTGLRGLGQALMGDGKPVDADLLLSHTHWAHIQGIPFFAPRYSASTRLRIWGWARGAALESVLRDQMSSAVFPVPIDELPSQVEFCTVEDGREYELSVRLSAFAVQHPGGALGYRVSGGIGGASMVYIPDVELAPHGPYRTPDGWRDRLVQWIGGAQVLVHDATYTQGEVEGHRGLGHSTCDEAVALALDAGVRQLVLFHHKPERTDDEVDGIVAYCRGLAGVQEGGLEIVAAAEGMELTV
jgi:phosphoribosyl 1,2-cyclic phosphodiesterase